MDTCLGELLDGNSLHVFLTLCFFASIRVYALSNAQYPAQVMKLHANMTMQASAGRSSYHEDDEVTSGQS